MRTQASSGSEAASPHTPQLLPSARADSAARATRSSNAGCHGSCSRETRRDLPVGSEGVLRQVVGPQGQELHLLEQRPRPQSRRGHLDHHSALRPEPGATGRRRRTPWRPPGQPPWGHDLEVDGQSLGGLGQRRQLGLQHLGVIKQAPQTPHSQRRVRLVGRGEETQRLVGSGVEHADDDAALGERLEDLAVGPRSAAPRRAPSRGRRGRGTRCGRDRRPPRPPRARPRRSAGPPMLASSGTVCPSEVAPGPEVSASAAFRSSATRRQLRALLAHSGSTKTSPVLPSTATTVPSPSSPGPRQRHDGRHTQRPGEDRAVTGGPALLRDEAEHQGGVQQRRVRGSQITGDQDVRARRCPGLPAWARRAAARRCGSRTSSRSATRPAR